MSVSRASVSSETPPGRLPRTGFGPAGLGREYKGSALVVYGHTPVPEAVYVNNTVDIDQGCVLGGKLTALRYPEREIVQVPALAVYYMRAGFSAQEPGRGRIWQPG